MNICRLLSVALIGLVLYSCRPEWTPEERANFLTGCVSLNTEHANKKPAEFCLCLQRKVEAAYPEHDLDILEPDSLQKYQTFCTDSLNGTPVVWPESAKKIFITECEKLAAEQKRIDPPAFCNCVLNGVMARYPSAEEMSMLNPDSMRAIGKNCE